MNTTASRMIKHHITSVTKRHKEASINDLTKIANEVHKQIEALKYIGGKTRDGIPTGEGVAINILLLPCLALDFREYNIKKEKRVCTVGGRAARMACALLHLQDEEDGTYGIQLLTRTGELGKLLLASEFTLEGAIRHQRHLNLDLVQTRPGEPRCVTFAQEGARPNTHNPLINNELRVEDLDDSRVTRAIQRATAICFTSTRSPHFLELIDRITDLLDKRRTPIFLDMLRPGSNKTLSEFFSKLKERTYTPPFHILLPDEQSSNLLRLLKVKDVPTLCSQYHTRVITYSASSPDIIVTDDDGTPYATAGLKPIIGEDVAIRFKAGVVLAESLFQAIQALPSDTAPQTHSLKNTLLDLWSEKHWKNVIQYGAAMAVAGPLEAEKHEGYCSLAQLVSLAPIESPHFRAASEASLVRTEMIPDFPKPNESAQFLLQPQFTTDVAQLAGLRRGPVTAPNPPRSALYRPDHSVCTKADPKCGDDCPKRREAASTTAAVMIDLDSTLMNSTAERRKAVSVALRRLLSALDGARGGGAAKASHPKDLSDPGSFFESYIYSQWPVFQLMGRGDFRQKWNHPGWYASFIVFHGHEELRENFKEACAKFVALFEKYPQEVAYEKYGALEIESLKKAKWWGTFSAEYDNTLRVHRDLIKAAQEVFENVELTSYKEARDFLKSLKDTGAFNLYVVSEGDPETQWLKLKSTGLDEFIGRDRLLTTGEAADPIRELQQLSEEQEAIGKQYTEAVRRYHSADQRVFDSGGLLKVLLARIENPEARAQLAEELDHRSQEDQKTLPAQKGTTRRLDLYQSAISFAKAVINRMAKKRGKPFYAAVVRSILRNRNSPVNELRNFSRLMDKPRTQEPIKIKFAMIGDRQDNDIDPPSELLGREHLLTIRIRSEREGKHAEPSDYPPNYLVDSLAQAKAIMLCKGTWDHIWCKDAPPIFNWSEMPRCAGKKGALYDTQENRVSTALLLAGMSYSSQPDSLTRKICARVLHEQLANQAEKWNDDDVDKAMDKCLEWPADEQDGFGLEVRQARVLCALVVHAQLCSERLLCRLTEKIAAKIAELHGQLKGSAPRTDPISLEQAATFLELESALRIISVEGLPAAQNIAISALGIEPFWPGVSFQATVG